MTKYNIIIFLLFCFTVRGQNKQPDKIKVRKNKIDTVTLITQEAEFYGGPTALANFIKTNIKYPDSVTKGLVKGKVFLKITITDNGSVTNIQIIKGLNNCSQCDTEAIQVAKLLPKFAPAMVDSKYVVSTYNLTIPFQPDKKE